MTVAHQTFAIAAQAKVLPEGITLKKVPATQEHFDFVCGRPVSGCKAIEIYHREKKVAVVIVHIASRTVFHWMVAFKSLETIGRNANGEKFSYLILQNQTNELLLAECRSMLGDGFSIVTQDSVHPPIHEIFLQRKGFLRVVGEKPAPVAKRSYANKTHRRGLFSPVSYEQQPVKVLRDASGEEGASFSALSLRGKIIKIREEVQAFKSLSANLLSVFKKETA